MAKELITVKEFTEFKNVGRKIDEPKIRECIELAQSVDMFDNLDEFYFDVLENKTSAAYRDLMVGSSFTVNGERFRHEGLKSLIADYTYARYLYIINANLTPFGATTKLTQDSKPLDRNILRDMVKQSQVDASVKFRMIDKYLRENEGTFPRYCKKNNSFINTYSQKFSTLDSRDYDLDNNAYNRRYNNE